MSAEEQVAAVRLALDFYRSTAPYQADENGWRAIAADLGSFARTAWEPFAALAALAARTEKAEEAVATADDLLRRLAEWDVLFVAADGVAVTADAPYWQREIATTRAVLAAPEDTGCEHEWVDARNPVCESGEVCVKCHAIRAGNTTAPEDTGRKGSGIPGVVAVSDGGIDVRGAACAAPEDTG